MDWSFASRDVPDGGERVEFGDDGVRSPEAPVVPVAPGADPALVGATCRVLGAAARHMGRDIHWLRVDVAGGVGVDSSTEEDRSADEDRSTAGDLPVATVRTLQRFRVGLLGPLAGTRSAALRVDRVLRDHLDLRTGVARHCSLDWLPTPVRDNALDVVVFRNLTEDAGAGLEYSPGAPETAALGDVLEDTSREPLPDPPVGYSVGPASREATRDLVDDAMDYAYDHDRDALTVAHQSDLRPGAEGSFRAWARDHLADEHAEGTVSEAAFRNDLGGTYPADEVVVRERLTTALCRDLLGEAAAHDVVVAPALGGTVCSAVAAEAAGTTGGVPELLLGDGCLVLRAGAPDRTGDGFARGLEGAGFDGVGLDGAGFDGAGDAGGPAARGAPGPNPVGLFLAGCLLFEYLGWMDAASAVRTAVSATLADGLLPPGVAARSLHGTPVALATFADAVVDRLGAPGSEPGTGGVRTRADERAAIKRFIAGLYGTVFEDDLDPAALELNQLLGEDEEADISMPEVGLNFTYWRDWPVERRLEVLLHEFAHVDEGPDERDHGEEFYERFVELVDVAEDWAPELETLAGEPIDFHRLKRFVVESVHEETIEPDVETVSARTRWLRERFDLDAAEHY